MTRAFVFLAVGPLVGIVTGAAFGLLGIGAAPHLMALFFLPLIYVAPLIYIAAIVPALLLLAVDWFWAARLSRSVLRIGATSVTGALVIGLLDMMWGSTNLDVSLTVGAIGGVSAAICSWFSGRSEPGIRPTRQAVSPDHSEGTGPIRDYRGEI